MGTGASLPILLSARRRIAAEMRRRGRASDQTFQRWMTQPNTN